MKVTKPFLPGNLRLINHGFFLPSFLMVHPALLGLHPHELVVAGTTSAFAKPTTLNNFETSLTLFGARIDKTKIKLFTHSILSHSHDTRPNRIHSFTNPTTKNKKVQIPIIVCRRRVWVRSPDWCSSTSNQHIFVHFKNGNTFRK